MPEPTKPELIDELWSILTAPSMRDKNTEEESK